MKIRNGFVSNSSSSSFCLYGWQYDNTKWEKMYELKTKLAKDSPQFALFEVTDRDGNYILGVGHTATDIDHYDDNWEDYRCNPPGKEEKKWIEEMSKKHNLPYPKIYEDTFRDG